MRSLHTPTDLAEYSRHIAFHGGLIIKRLLFWRHLVAQESCECRLIYATFWLLDCLIKCIIEAFRMLRTQLLLCLITHFPRESWTMALRAASVNIWPPRWSRLLRLVVHALSTITCWALLSIEFSFHSSQLPETEFLWVICQLLRKWIMVSVTLWLLFLLQGALVWRSCLWTENLIFDSHRVWIVI